MKTTRWSLYWMIVKSLLFKGLFYLVTIVSILFVSILWQILKNQERLMVCHKICLGIKSRVLSSKFKFWKIADCIGFRSKILLTLILVIDFSDIIKCLSFQVYLLKLFELWSERITKNSWLLFDQLRLKDQTI